MGGGMFDARGGMERRRCLRVGMVALCAMKGVMRQNGVGHLCEHRVAVVVIVVVVVGQR